MVNQITPADISDPGEVIARAQALSLELGTAITPGFEAPVFKASRGIEDIYELTYICKDGSRLPAVVLVTALRDAQNAIIGYLLIGTDNTARQQIEAERKRVEEALLASELFAKATLDAASAHICVLDKTGRMLAVNQAWRDFETENNPDPQHPNLTGSIGINYLEVCDRAVGAHADEAVLMGDDIRKVINGEHDQITVEYPCHSATEKRWFIARVTRFHGNSGNVVVAHEDITTRKLAELREQHHTGCCECWRPSRR